MTSAKSYQDVLASLKENYESELMLCRQLQSRVSQKSKDRDALLMKFNAISIDLKSLQQDLNRKRAEMTGYSEAKLTLRKQIDTEKSTFDGKKKTLADLHAQIDAIRKEKANVLNAHCDDMRKLTESFLQARQQFKVSLMQYTARGEEEEKNGL